MKMATIRYEREIDYRSFSINQILIFILQWTDIEQMNTDDVEEEYKKRLSEIAINECCCLVYTVSTFVI